jgi:hypothetical protein
MTDDSGLMSVDFLVGFTIFIIAFIWIATMVPGLFIGLQTRSIDYDAVAYRTGVILVEDPGASSIIAAGQPWETITDKRDIIRFGLAVSKDTPRILDQNKVNRFFNQTDFSYPDDYQSRVIFGDYPYRFNISLKIVGEDTLRSVGDVVPENYQYGYIRRDVKIKSLSNTTIGKTIITEHNFHNSDNVTLNQFSIVINSSHLLSGKVGENSDPSGDIAYRINPNWDRIMINITDLEETRNILAHPSPPTKVCLTEVKFSESHENDVNLYSFTIPLAFENFTYVNWSPRAEKLPVEIMDSNVSLVFEPGFFSGTDKYGAIYLNLTFELDPPQQYLNNTHTRPFDYNYNPANVTQPALTDAVMEVAVW